MIYTKSIHVDMARQYLNDIIRLHEGDANGAQLQISLFNNGAAFDLTNYTVKYDAVIAGYLAENDAAADRSSNMITVPITANMCAKSGTLEIDVKILEGSGDDERVFFLQRFEANVQRRVINEDVIIDVSGTTIGEKIAALEARFPVKTEDINDAAVTSEKINAGAVLEGNIRGGAVTTSKIANNAVTANKIADGAVTLGKIGEDTHEYFMRLAFPIVRDDTSNIKQGQLFFYNGRYYIKDYYQPGTASQTAIASYEDVTNLGTRVDALENVVGNANAILEAALHYQNGG